MAHKLMRGIGVLALAAGGAALLAQTLRAQEKPLDVVPKVDFERYAGTWFEIARLPKMDPALYEKLKERAKAQGFDVSRLIQPEQTGR